MKMKGFSNHYFSSPDLGIGVGVGEGKTPLLLRNRNNNVSTPSENPEDYRFNYVQYIY